ncbi:1-aminocyclopropane-1-carboxylate synthase-like protein 1 [Procambarus clarkii]|uniref:1-aminocyclopropane-1-carboxylate synthase-like protein 1 n=1 Tax=Procambarus clarkii TaxID=6728 RepID=UPI001E673FE0|nr:1-aminocyclopropane-1-carboxylate synthase-like protein 1 [Procambarus clarkii]XP_045601333.1 1-aminocyclopropane-1-carboxylate synthase-like protein 1 [Procambarus clarkii]XP_045601334.1 1-aminocyclopropane-1-carboxylate synthase-like protein 1 [Procambarus clarkii]
MSSVTATTRQVDNAFLSARGAKTASYKDFLYDTFAKVLENIFDAKQNPQGTVNLGTSVNCLMEEELTSRLMQGDALNVLTKHLQYAPWSGSLKVREAVANFLNRHLHPRQAILPNNLVLGCGVTSCLDALAHTLCDAGDVIITPTPVYARIFTDVRDVSDVCVEPLVLSDKEDSNGVRFSLEANSLEHCIKKLKTEGRRVRAFILINPHNPLGDIYPPSLVAQLMDVCARHQIHFISDEIYALTVFDEDSTFRSALTLDLPDPHRTHILWAVSKDFGFAGARFATIITFSDEVLACLSNAAAFKNIPLIMQHAIATLLNDTAWCDEYFLPTNKKRIAQNYKITLEHLEKMGVTVKKSKAGLFVWFNVQAFMKQQTEEEEMALYGELLDAGLYINPGARMYCSSPGWMRLIFAVKLPVLEEGLKRLESVLMARKRKLD